MHLRSVLVNDPYTPYAILILQYFMVRKKIINLTQEYQTSNNSFVVALVKGSKLVKKKPHEIIKIKFTRNLRTLFITSIAINITSLDHLYKRRKIGYENVYFFN